MGGSSGGSSGGKVDYPSYMKDRHARYLDKIESLLPAPNPFKDAHAPSIDRLLNNNALFYLDAYLNARIKEAHELPLVANISLCMQQPQFYSQIMQMICLVLEYVENHHDIEVPKNLATQVQLLAGRLQELDEITDLTGRVEFESAVLPRFQGGMRDINAVQMSTFIVGRAVMEGVYASKVTEVRETLKNEIWKLLTESRNQMDHIALDAKKADATRIQSLFHVVGQLMTVGGTVSGSIDALRVQLETSLQHLRAEFMKIRESSLNHLDNLVDASTGKSIELSRMQIVAMFEQSNVDMDYGEKRYRWDLENFQYLANMLASIGGGTAVAGGRQTSKFTSALGGALSGAATGAMVAPGAPVAGAAVGALLGIGASLLG